VITAPGVVERGSAVIPEAHALLALAGDCGFPAVSVGRAVVRGETGWARALHGCPPAIPRERAVLLRGLEKPPLVSTPGGRARLRAWIAAQKTAPSTPLPSWLAATWIREKVSFYGDASMLPGVVAALSRVPAPVRDAALAEVAFLAVGADTCGWMGSSTLLDRDGARRPRIIVLSGHDLADVERITLHEIAHAWAAALPHEGSMLTTAQAEERVFALARREGWIARAEAHVQRDERLAVALEKIWATRV
jgi:hypothetical protein